MGKEFDDLAIKPVTDQSGAVIETDDVISRAMAAQEISFTFDGLDYMTWICKTQVSSRLSNRVTGIQSKLALLAGFTAGEEIAEDDSRVGRLMELMSENETLEAAQTDIAVAATICKDGKPLTSVPQLAQSKFDRDVLLNLGGLGGAYVEAVLNALRPTSAEAPPEAGAAAAPKTKKASTTKRSAS